jgi:mono/diheme cytochrome c family protein
MEYRREIPQHSASTKGEIMTMRTARILARSQFLLGVLILFAVTVAPAAFQALPTKKAQPPAPMVKGADLFNNYCAACHGPEAKGNGPLANLLKSKPADLTIIARKNGGQFPAAAVRKMIAGDDPSVPLHGTRTMPIWGPIFRDVQADQVPAGVRLDNLVKYLETLQQK